MFSLKLYMLPNLSSHNIGCDNDQGLEHNQIWLVIAMVLCIANPAPQLMTRMYSHKLISNKGWQLSNFGSSDIC
jgi:hypothetical protein